MFVSELCLGAMTFGGRGQIWESDRRTRTVGGRRHRPPRARRGHQLRRHRGRLLGRRVREDGRQGARPAGGTRSCWRRRSAAGWGNGPNQVGLSRLHIMEAVEASLKRLGTDYIDLYQIHRFDPLTNIEDTLRALDDLVRAGKVRYIGCSNLPAWQLMKALAISREQRLERFRCTQSYYSLAGRELEREMIPLLRIRGWACWCGVRSRADSCPASSRATAATRRRAGRSSISRRSTRTRRSTILDVLRASPRSTARRVPQVALAWMLAKRRSSRASSSARGKSRSSTTTSRLSIVDADRRGPEGARRGQQS